MKYFIAIILLLPLKAQCQHAVIAATKMNILYIGIENPISIAVENTKCSELTLNVDNGSAKMESNCTYKVMVTKPGNSFLYIIKGKDTISKTLFKVKFIPDPVADRVPYNRSRIMLDSIRNQKGLTKIIEQINVDNDFFQFSVVSFELIVVRYKNVFKKDDLYCGNCFKKLGEEPIEVVFTGKNKGGTFNSSLNDFIQSQLKQGDLIFFENIKVLGPDSRVRGLNPINYEIQ